MIVSITTTGRRIGRIVPTLKSILDGTVKPDKLILWLNRDPSPVGPGVQPADIPPAVGDMGCEVRWCENLGPATKLLPAMQAFPDRRIITADDDIIYQPTWLQRLTEGSDVYAGSIICYRARKVRFDKDHRVLPYNKWPLIKHCQGGPERSLVPTGVHGVLYPPGSLRPEAFDYNKLRQLSLPNDDLWFAVTRTSDPVIIKRSGNPRNVGIRGPRLSRRNLRGRNDQIIRALTDHFGNQCPWSKP
jgi:hypothetical protein